MAGDALLRIKVVVDAAAAATGLDKVDKSASRFRKGMAKAAVPAGLALGAIVAFGKGAVDAASATEQAMGGLDAVFGASADTVKGWANAAADSVGLAASEYGNLATVIGSQLKNAGLPLDQVATKTDTLIKLGADLAATYGGSTADAVSALSSALKGEMDPLERYGTSLTAAKVSAELAAKGQSKLTGSAASAAKANATLGLIMGQTADATGKFASESDTLAGAQARSAAQWENAKATLGESLLPLMTQLTDALSKVAQWAAQNATVVKILVGVLAAMAAAIMVINVVMAILAVVSSPVSLIILAIVAAVAALVFITVLLWRKSELFRTVVTAVWNAVRVAAVATWNAIKVAATATWSFLTGQWRDFATYWTGVWTKIKSAATTVWAAIQAAAAPAVAAVHAVAAAWDAVVAAIQSVISWIGRIHFPSAPSWLSKLPGVNLSATTAGVSPTLAAAAPGATASAAAGGGNVFNFYGVLDGVDAGRKLRQVLREDDRRRAGVRVGVGVPG
jgi:hypothetical protein